jgi:hypothetical protein
MRRIVGIAAAAAGIAALAGAAAPPQEEHVRGTVASVAGDAVTVKAEDGRTVKLKLGDQTKVAALERADPSAVAKGAWIGATTVQAKDGTLRALEVHVFPEAMRGSGAGQHPWDRKPGSTMTNATVSGAEASAGAQSTMTNANVSAASGGAGGTKLTLSLPEGEKTVVVAPGTPVVKLQPADRSAIVQGAHVFAAGPRQPDGTVAVGRIFVGKDGVVPPM